MSYIMITPVKDEDKFLSRVAKSVINQSEPPKLWVIIDGGSNDGTPETLERLAHLHDWIIPISQSDFSRRGGHTNVSIAVSTAYKFALEYCKRNGIDFDYVWTSNGDQVFPKNTCGGVIEKCREDSSIGVASGLIYDCDGHGKPILDVYPKGELPNKRVYLKKALDQIGGFPVTKYSYDTVILAKLRMNGWKVKLFPDYKIFNLRSDSGIERNAWKSHVQFGQARFYLGYSFPLVLLGCGYMVLHRKSVKPVGVFFGYTTSWMKQDEIIDDEMIWNHFHYDRIREVLRRKK